MTEIDIDLTQSKFMGQAKIRLWTSPRTYVIRLPVGAMGKRFAKYVSSDGVVIFADEKVGVVDCGGMRFSATQCLRNECCDITLGVKCSEYLDGLQKVPPHHYLLYEDVPNAIYRCVPTDEVPKPKPNSIFRYGSPEKKHEPAVTFRYGSMQNKQSGM